MRTEINFKQKIFSLNFGTLNDGLISAKQSFIIIIMFSPSFLYVNKFVFINIFYIFKCEITFSFFFTCKNKNVQIFLWLLFDCCVFYINLNDCNIFSWYQCFCRTLLWGWGSGCNALCCFLSLSGWVLPPASEAVTPSTSRLAAELNPTGPSSCGNSASFTSSAVDRRILCASPRWDSFTEAVERRLRGAEEDCKQGGGAKTVSYCSLKVKIRSWTWAEWITEAWPVYINMNVSI